MRLSTTSRLANKPRFWKVRATPILTTAGGRRPRSSLPSSLLDPRWGRYTPFRQLKIDVLPAPLGPMMAKSSPWSVVKLTLARAATPPKRRVTSVASSRGAISPTPSRAPPLLAAVGLDVAEGPPPGLAHAEVELLHVLVGQQLLAGAVLHDATVLH